MKNILIAFALVSFVTLSACGGCKKKEEVKTEVATTAPVAPAATEVAPSTTPATEQAPK